METFGVIFGFILFVAVVAIIIKISDTPNKQENNTKYSDYFNEIYRTGTLREKDGDTDGAICEYEKIVDAKYPLIEAYYNLNRMYIRKDDTANQIKTLKLIIDLISKDDPQGAYFEKKQLQRLTETETERLKRIKYITPENDYAAYCYEWSDLAQKYLKENRVNDAIYAFEKFIITRRPTAYVYKMLIDLYRQIGDIENEIRILEITIDVLSKANDEQAQKKIDAHPEFVEEIQDAYLANRDFMRIYIPYKINKYKERLKQLQSKQ